MQINCVTYCRRIRRELKCLCGAEKWWAQKYLNRGVNRDVMNKTARVAGVNFTLHNRTAIPGSL